MKRKAQSLDPGQPGADTRLTFDQHVRQLSTMRQSAHQLVIWLVIGAIIVTFGALIFAVYQSIIWKIVGETDVMQAWMYFFLTGAFAAALLGFDTLIVGATIPAPFERSKYAYETGPGAVRSGWELLGIGVIATVLVSIGINSVRAGTLSIEDWISYLVGFFVILGVGSGFLAFMRRVLRTRNS
jgi:hypothetical protein